MIFGYRNIFFKHRKIHSSQIWATFVQFEVFQFRSNVPSLVVLRYILYNIKIGINFISFTLGILYEIRKNIPVIFPLPQPLAFQSPFPHPLSPIPFPLSPCFPFPFSPCFPFHPTPPLFPFHLISLQAIEFLMDKVFMLINFVLSLSCLYTMGIFLPL